LTEIISGHMDNIYEIVEKDYPETGIDRFSTDVTIAFKLMVGKNFQII